MSAAHFWQEWPIHDSMPKCLTGCTFATRGCATIVLLSSRDALQGLHVPFDDSGRMRLTSGAGES